MAEKNETDLIVVEETKPAPVKLTAEAIQVIKENINMAQRLVCDVLEEEVDYGQLPGTPAPGLWDPGASKIEAAFNVYPKYNILHSEETDGVISKTIESTLISRSTGNVFSTGIGAASTKETKYRYRWMSKDDAVRVLGFPEEALDKMKRKTGAGGGVLYRVENPEHGELVNTITKMAAKRADVDAVQNLPGVGSTLRKLFQVPKNRRDEWKDFWGKTAQMGLSEEQVHEILGVASMKDWQGQGKTLKDAITALAKRPQTQPAPAKEEKAEIPTQPDIPLDDKLITGWNILKGKVQALSIQDWQLKNWCDHYKYPPITLEDLSKPLPPQGITNGIVNHLVDALNSYSDMMKRKAEEAKAKAKPQSPPVVS